MKKRKDIVETQHFVKLSKGVTTMREILFRGKDVKENWYIGLLAKSGNGWYISNSAGIPLAFEVIPSTVGQYTGLTDNNGTKIFEGDIVKHHFGEEKGIVKFGEYRQPFNDDIHTKHIGFYVDWISGEEKELLRKDLGYWVNLDKNFDYEIFIGENIHDNPELLNLLEIPNS